MMKSVKTRLDAFALVFGDISIAGAFGVLPFGAQPFARNDRINAAWDQKLRKGSPDDCPEFDPECASSGWAT